MAEGNVVAGVVTESVRADAEAIRKIISDIESDMQNYVEQMKGTMKTDVEVGFAENFRSDLDRIYNEKVNAIEEILNANAMNMNTATDLMEAYSNNNDYNSVN